MADKFEDLRTFVTVAETGGIGTAAAALGIVKSAVSRRLAELEERLGVTLVERTTRSFALTETGRRFLERARALLGDLDGLERIGTDAPGAPLTVSADAAIVDAVLRAAAALRTTMPNLHVTMTGIGAPEIIISLGRAATALETDPSILGTTALVHCASPEYLERRGTPIAAADLPEHDMIAIADGKGADRSRRSIGWLEVADAQIAVLAAVAGAGIATVPRTAIGTAVIARSLAVLPLASTSEPLSVVGSARAEAPPAAALLLDQIATDLRAGSG